MKKTLRILFLLSAAVLSLLLFSSCNKAEPEKVDIRTTLTVDHSFSGKRTIVLTFPQSVISTGSDTETNLEKVVQKHCPNSLTPSKGYAEGKIQYSFEMSFESAHEYTNKTSDIAGFQTVVNFSNPHNVMTQGWKLEENFQSAQLILNWITAGAKEEGFSGLDFTTTETKTTVSLNDQTQSTTPVISVNCLEGYPIQRIKIITVRDKNIYDRSIIFTISQSTFDAMPSEIKEYFSSVTDRAAISAEWLLNTNSSYDYTVKFNDVTLQELTGYTNKLLNTVYGDIEYTDKGAGSTVLAEQNSYTETLDFSNYIGNNNTNVPVEYTYSVAGNTELGECQLYENGEWHVATDFLDDNQYSKVSSIKYNGSLMHLRINDGKQYTATSVEIDSVPLEEDKLQKTITFKFSRSAGGDEASNYARVYLDSLGYGAVQTVMNDECICTYTTSGTPETLNDIFTHILGGKNTTKYTSQSQFMTLRTMKCYNERLDLSALRLGKNAETPFIYRVTAQNGNFVKEFRFSSSEASQWADLSTIDNGCISMKLVGTDVNVSFNITCPNVSDIVFCSIIAGIMVLIAVFAIFFLRSRKLPSPSLGGSSSPALGGGQNSLTVKKKTTDLKKKTTDPKKK